MSDATYNGMTLRQVRRAAVIDRVNGILCAVIGVSCVLLAFGGVL